MPCDYKNYSPLWKSEIRPRILERAKHCCEICGVKNYEVGYRDIDGKFYSVKTIMDLLEDKGYDIFCNELSHVAEKAKPIKIILTIMHLDHDIKNNDDSNLRAGCQRCHNRHDVEHRKDNRAKKKNLQSLF